MIPPRELVDDIRALESPQGPVVVAIDGRSASGKTTLALWLAAELGATLVHMDDFYRDMPEPARWLLRPAQGVEQFFDWQRLRREALEPLSRGHAVSYRGYDWDAGGGLSAEHHVVEAAAVVILEGVYAARPELDDLVHLRVLVDASPERRARRRLERADHQGLEARWDAAEEFYFTEIRPPDTFHRVLDGDVSLDARP
jgi:uridine kinase